jgi:hypothetical protein
LQQNFSALAIFLHVAGTLCNIAVSRPPPVAMVACLSSPFEKLFCARLKSESNGLKSLAGLLSRI